MAGPGQICFQVLRTVWVLVSNLVCIPCYLGWLALLSPVWIFSREAYTKIEEVLFNWLLSIVSCWVWSAGFSVVETGDSLDSLAGSRLLLLPNHQSTADVPLLMSIFTARQAFTNKVMWIMDRVFKFTNFGVVAACHDDFFIRSGKAGRDLTLVELRDHLNTVYIPKKRQYMVLFPEGGFLRKRKAVSHEFAKKNDLPLLEHVTLPRTGALEVVMAVLGPDSQLDPANRLEKIVDMTLAYPGGQPLDLQSIVTGWREPCVTHVHYRQWSTSEVPQSPEQLFTWMVERYKEKEAMLAEYYTTGVFPATMFPTPTQPPGPPRPVTHDPLRFILLHIFFVLSAIAFYGLAESVFSFIAA